MVEVINLIDINFLTIGYIVNKNLSFKRAGMVIYNIISKSYIAKIIIKNLLKIVQKLYYSKVEPII